MNEYQVKAAVRRRDGMRCVECGITNAAHKKAHKGASLHVHRRDADGPYTLDNCETLCYACHGPHRRKINGLFKSGKEGAALLVVEVDAETAALLRELARYSYGGIRRVVGNAIILAHQMERFANSIGKKLIK